MREPAHRRLAGDGRGRARSRRSFIDGAGDAISTMTLAGPVDEIEIVVEGASRPTDTAGVLREHREVISPRVYLVPTAATKANPAADRDCVTAALEGVGARRAARPGAPAGRGGGGRDRLRAGRPRRPRRRPPEALDTGEGVCQDHAHALIAVAHAAGDAGALRHRLPAGRGRRSRRGEPRLGRDSTYRASAGSGSTRRTAAVPTTATSGSARAATPREAAPIRGVSRGGGAEELEVTSSCRSAQCSRKPSAVTAARRRP